MIVKMTTKTTIMMMIIIKKQLYDNCHTSEKKEKGRERDRERFMCRSMRISFLNLDTNFNNNINNLTLNYSVSSHSYCIINNGVSLLALSTCTCSYIALFLRVELPFLHRFLSCIDQTFLHLIFPSRVAGSDIACHGLTLNALLSFILNLQLIYPLYYYYNYYPFIEPATYLSTITTTSTTVALFPAA